MKEKIDAKQFIEAWQTSTSTREVAETLQISWEKNTASQLGSRACFYRSKGIKLKSFTTGRRPTLRLNWNKLSEVAEMYNEKE